MPTASPDGSRRGLDAGTQRWPLHGEAARAQGPGQRAVRLSDSTVWRRAAMLGRRGTRAQPVREILRFQAGEPVIVRSKSIDGLRIHRWHVPTPAGATLGAHSVRNWA